MPMDDEINDLATPITFVIKRDISHNHRVMCPHCQEFIDLTTKIRISQVANGFAFSIEHYTLEKILQDKLEPEILGCKKEQVRI